MQPYPPATYERAYETAHTRPAPGGTPGSASCLCPARMPLTASALGEPSTQGGTSSGSPVPAVQLGTEVRRLSTRPLASAKGDAGTAISASGRLRPEPPNEEPPHRNGDGTWHGREPPVACLPSSGNVYIQTAKA